jgi:hypothetical protein
VAAHNSRVVEAALKSSFSFRPYREAAARAAKAAVGGGNFDDANGNFADGALRFNEIQNFVRDISR